MGERGPWGRFLAAVLRNTASNLPGGLRSTLGAGRQELLQVAPDDPPIRARARDRREVDAPLAGDLPHERAGEDPRSVHPGRRLRARWWSMSHRPHSLVDDVPSTTFRMAAGLAFRCRGRRLCRRRFRRWRPGPRWGRRSRRCRRPQAAGAPRPRPLRRHTRPAPSRSRSPQEAGRQQRCRQAPPASWRSQPQKRQRGRWASAPRRPLPPHLTRRAGSRGRRGDSWRCSGGLSPGICPKALATR